MAFATHGLVAGELGGVSEPVLVLPPPAEGTESDDGLLTASEVAQLKLNADWVILSACNTVATDGTPAQTAYQDWRRRSSMRAVALFWSRTGRYSPMLL